MSPPLRRLLPLLAATVALLAATDSPPPFTDTSENARTNVVNGNFHLYCAQKKPIKVFLEQSEATFDDLVAIDGSWFALKCGAPATLITEALVVACPPPECDHACTFKNGGGAEPKASCTYNGDPVRTCPGGAGKLYVGWEEFELAECRSDGKWYLHDGLDWLINGVATLEAACSPIACRPPTPLGAAELAAIAANPQLALAPTTLARPVSADGRSTYACPPGSVLVSVDGAAFTVLSPKSLRCEAASGEWKLVEDGQADATYNSKPVECITVASVCPPAALLTGADAGLAANNLTLHPTALVFSASATKFELSCPAGSDLAVLAGSTLVSRTAAGGKRLQCSGTGWTLYDGSASTAVAAGQKVGCVAQACATPITYLTQAQVASFVGVTVDATQRDAPAGEGFLLLQCALGSQFASLKGGQLAVAAVDVQAGMYCDTITTEGWRVVMGTDDAAYASAPVACIKPTCSDLLLFDGTESLIIAKQDEYTMARGIPAYAGNRWAFKCPDGFGIGYAETPTLFRFVPTMKITCETTGWFVKSNATDPGTGLSPVKVGCFSKIIVPTVPTPSTCSELVYLTADDIKSYAGVNVTAQKAAIDGDNNQLKCAAGSSFAYLSMSGNNLFVLDYWLSCQSLYEGWRVKDASGRDETLTSVKVGCVKPSIELEQFTGDEELLEDYPIYELIPTQPTFVGGRYELACPVNTSIGYAETETTFTFNPSLKLTCEVGGWTARTSAGSTGSAFPSVKVGCFRKHPNCPPLAMLNATYSDAEHGIAVDTTQKVAVFPLSQSLKCTPGSELVAWTGDDLTVAQRGIWLSCANDAVDGWRVRLEGTNETQPFYMGLIVGCIKPACAPIALFTGTEPLLTKNASLQFVQITTARNPYTNYFEMSCPPGAAIGWDNNIAGAAQAIVRDPAANFTCKSTGWRNASDAPVSTTVKTGCFYSYASCPAIKSLNATHIASVPGAALDATQVVKKNQGVSELRCAAGTTLAVFEYGRLIIITGASISCNGSTEAGWRYRAANDDEETTSFGMAPIGCIKPLCPAMNLFTGAEPLLTKNPNMQYAPLKAEFSAELNRFRVSCPAGADIGWDNALAGVNNAILRDSSNAITCEAAGWRLKSTAFPNGVALAAGKMGCFYFYDNCAPPLTYLTPAKLVAGGTLNTTVDVAQTAKLINGTYGTYQFKCAAGSAFGLAFDDDTIVGFPDTSLSCDTTARNGWRIIMTGVNQSFGDSTHTYPVGCLKPTCTVAVALFVGTEPLLTKNPALQFAPAKPEFDVNSRRFGMYCPEGAVLGWDNGLAGAAQAIVRDPSATIMCEATGWMKRSDTNINGSLSGAVKTGCFYSTETCPAVTYLNATHVAGSPGVAVDATAKVVTVAGVSKLICPAGTTLAAYVSGTLTAYAGSALTCDGAKANGWRRLDPTSGEVAFAAAPVGCVKATCAAMALFVGTEPLLTKNANLQYAPIAPIFTTVANRIVMTCPPGAAIGRDNLVAGAANAIVRDTSASIRCETTGWMIRTATNVNGSAVGAAKTGCFYSLEACPALTYLNAAHLSLSPGVVLDATQTVQKTNGVSEFKCGADTPLAVYADGKLTLMTGATLSCDGSTTEGWKMTPNGGGAPTVYSMTPLGCIKPTCTGMALFTGTEASIAKNASLTFAQIKPRFFDTTNRFTMVCPGDSAIGWEDASGNVVRDRTASITCEAAGWRVRSGGSTADAPITTAKIGCFYFQNCFSVKYLNPTLLANTPGVALDYTQSVDFVGNMDQLKCAPGTALAILVAGKVSVFPGAELSCNNSATNGFRLISAAGDESPLFEGANTVGCVMPRCAAPSFFTGTEPLLTKDPLLKYSPIGAAFNAAKARFELVCPPGSEIGWDNGGTGAAQIIDHDPSIQITCETTSWRTVTAAVPAGASITTNKIGCFAVSLGNGCQSLSSLTAAQIATMPGASIDATQKLQNVTGSLKFSCAAGTTFAAFSGGKIVVLPGATLTCDASTSNSWALYDPPRGTIAYGLEPYACIKESGCPSLSTLTAAHIATVPGASIDAAQKMQIVSGASKMECAPGTTFAAWTGVPGRVEILPGASITCSAATSFKWSLYDPPRGTIAYGGEPYACIKEPGCPSLAYLTAAQISTVPGATIDATQRLQVSGGTSLMTCAAGSTLAAWSGGRIVTLPNGNLTCGAGTSNQWRLFDPPRGTITYGLEPFACVKETKCPALQYLTPAHIATRQGASIDTAQRLKLAGGLNTFSCTAGTTFAVWIGGAMLSLPGSNLTCNYAGTGGWVLYDPTRGNIAYGGEPYACIKEPLCPSIPYVLPTQLASKPGCSIDAAQRLNTTAAGFSFSCSAGTTLATLTGAQLTTYPGASLTCNYTAGGKWQLNDPTLSSADYGLQPFACIKETLCPAIPYLSLAQIATRPGGAFIDTAQKVTTTSGVSKFSCVAGTTFAVWSGGAIVTLPGSSLTCNYAAAGGKWTLFDPARGNIAYGLEPFGCIKECATLSYLNASQLAGLPGATIDATQRLTTVGGLTKIECATGTTFAAFSGGKIVLLPGAAISCGVSTGNAWRLYDPPRGTIAYGQEAFACIKEAGCPTLSYMTAAQIGTVPGASIDTTQRLTVASGTQKLVCAAGSSFAAWSGGKIVTLPGASITCGPATTNAWAMSDPPRGTFAYGLEPFACVKETLCPTISYLTPAQIATRPGASRDGTGTQLVAGVNQFSCPAGTTFAVWYGGALLSLPGSSLSCNYTGTGRWVLYDPTRGNVDYGGESFACIKETKCASIPYMNPEQAATKPGASIDGSQRLQISGGVTKLSCTANTTFAVWSGGRMLTIPFSNLTCDYNGDGKWILYEPAQGTIYYGLEQFACVQETQCISLPTLTPAQGATVPGGLLDPYQRMTPASTFECAAGTTFGAWTGVPRRIQLLPGAKLSCPAGKWILYDPPRGSLTYGLEPYGCILV